MTKGTIDQRKYERTQINLTIRFVAPGGEETTGRLIDISAGGLAMQTDAPAKVGDQIIAYPEGLGRLIGKVARVFDGGLAIEFEMSDAQREAVRKRIHSAVTGVPYLRLLDKRKHKRIELNLDSEARLESSGERFDCQIVDISETGSQVRAEHKPPLGEIVRVGTLRGVVRRHTDIGFGIEFVKEDAPQPETPKTIANAQSAAS